MINYEIMYILDSNLDEENRKLEIEKINEIITKNNGEILEVNEWGNRELAYEINKQRKGYYVLLKIKTENNDLVNEFTRLIRINRNVFRFLVVKE